MARRTQAEVASSVLAAAGIPYTVHIGRKHVKVKWELEGRRFSYSCAKTPGDWRALENCRCEVRRILRASGIEA
ncbi:hypothetical protein P9A44_gp49 [Xanthomonas phage vB_Xar_IVIA-DoCa5]|uniref:Uncharacterized protein n=1 Tax=Xanthomonas phage vB_Xar_IVIA-DoCa5 TaxID=2975532 RepID=A0A9X9JP65_9CAUD|nr:hypothetical protein P9A44_gp49 [Xanthomonas phage vB_Xar_IVIA-DoCa5]UYA98719.1 hypothetical protein IVIADoCa5_49 [Xanthomonas phage vB_Xar_IVIA-DoCa5]